jgi:hypothetical protein
MTPNGHAKKQQQEINPPPSIKYITAQQNHN